MGKAGAAARRGRDVMGSRRVRMAVGSGLVALAAIAAMLWLAGVAAQDACLDGGGAWRDGACLR
ncbi:hypothetical protein GMJLKIPL_3856 [Methylobacterium isbiliense]|uniref:Uncharacterized protein n=1 Tax=Methylobacterium isbiliense TaxID=315478 RepID=A0ABQ4SHE3_9HYPH|nr:hypothetical protein GMJLKIPL_3856 [Methylobacterium isbiliense]